MKKLFVAAALVMGLGTSAAFADNFMVDSVTVTMINDFTPIEVKDLYNPQIEMFARFKMKSSFHKTKRII